jgi:hypothetical protein
MISSACVLNVELEENDLEDSRNGEALSDVNNSGEENDLEDSRSAEALFDVDNSGPKVLALHGDHFPRAYTWRLFSYSLVASMFVFLIMLDTTDES